MRRLELLLAVAGLALVGCSPAYLRVTSRLVESTRSNDREVTASPLYVQVRPSIKTVAVRAPDSCANENASAATGSAKQSGEVASTVIKTSCGVEMAELERALTRSGYQVVSWKTISNIVSTEAGVTYPEAAKRLGAQVLFQVNSLEKVNLVPGADARWERRFYESDAYGTQKDPAVLKDNVIRELRGIIAKQEASLRQGRLAAMLDVNAVSVDNGQTIWFYRASWVEETGSDSEVSALAKVNKNHWAAVQPKKRRSEAVTVERSAEMEAISSGERSADAERAAYFALVRTVVADFSSAFASGQSGGVALPEQGTIALPPDSK
jgi:hypothetical protein